MKGGGHLTHVPVREGIHPESSRMCSESLVGDGPARGEHDVGVSTPTIAAQHRHSAGGTSSPPLVVRGRDGLPCRPLGISATRFHNSGA